MHRLRAAAAASSKTHLMIVAMSVSILLLSGVAYGIHNIGREPETVEDSDRLLIGSARAVQTADFPPEAPASPATGNPTEQASPSAAAAASDAGTARRAPAGSPSGKQAPPLPSGEFGNFGSGGAGFDCNFAKAMFAGSTQDVDCFGLGHQGFVGEVRLSCSAPAGMTCELSETVVRPPRQFNGGTTHVPVNVRIFVPKGFPSGQHVVRLHYDAPTADPRFPHNEAGLPILVQDTSYFGNCSPLTMPAGTEAQTSCFAMLPVGSYRGPIYLSVRAITPGGPQPMLSITSVRDSNNTPFSVRFNSTGVAPGQYVYELEMTHIQGGPPEPQQSGMPFMTPRFTVTVG